jgi:hypothetical protein
MVATYHGRIAILLNPHARIGPHTIEFIRALWAPLTTEALQQERQLLSISRHYPAERFEAACRRALFYNQHNPNIETVRMILNHNLDDLPLDRSTDIYGQFLLDFSI